MEVVIKKGAAEGTRTLTNDLEGRGATITPQPHMVDFL